MRFLLQLFDIIIKLINFFLAKKDLQALITFKKLLLSSKAQVIFIIEEVNWSIRSDALYITDNLKKLGLINAELASTLLAKNKIVHFSSINCLFGTKGFTELRNKSNKKIVTWFHIVPTDERLKFVSLLNDKVDLVHTSNSIAKKQLVELGLRDDKIVIIPLGVDLSIFKVFRDEVKKNLKKKFKLPLKKKIIGSFQKDGVGWGEGLEPKWVKGPDIFCEVVKKISKNIDIHVLLTGPARGYVKMKLNEFKIPFTHIFLDNYLDIVECYNVLDLYIVTSRAEGGPKAILEGMATGVPILTTKVGMAPEIINHGLNGFMTDVENIQELYEYAIKLLNNLELRKKFIYEGLQTVKNYSWEKVSREYFTKIYKNFLSQV